MAFTLDPALRYHQPVVFGPTEIPDVTVIGNVRKAAVTFLTEREAIEQYLPDFFGLAGEPLVTISGAQNGDVDWLGGRQYNLVRVQVPVIYRGSETVTAPFDLVIWESDDKPVTLGREYQGYSKIVCDIPDHQRNGNELSFECSEYGNRLLRCEVKGLSPVSQEALADMNAAGQKQVVLGWKYIPSIEGGADVNYPVKFISRSVFREAWVGTGELFFEQPSWQQAPGSAHIIKALRSLPILEYRSALVSHSRLELVRNAVKRLR